MTFVASSPVPKTPSLPAEPSRRRGGLGVRRSVDVITSPEEAIGAGADDAHAGAIALDGERVSPRIEQGLVGVDEATVHELVCAGAAGVRMFGYEHRGRRAERLGLGEARVEPARLEARPVDGSAESTESEGEQRDPKPPTSEERRPRSGMEEFVWAHRGGVTHEVCRRAARANAEPAESDRPAEMSACRCRRTGMTTWRRRSVPCASVQERPLCKSRGALGRRGRAR